MDISVLIQVVNQVAFPILVSVACGWYVKYITDQNREQIDKIITQHHDEMNNITSALANNTLALQELTNYLKDKE